MLSSKTRRSLKSCFIKLLPNCRRLIFREIKGPSSLRSMFALTRSSRPPGLSILSTNLSSKSNPMTSSRTRDLNINSIQSKEPTLKMTSLLLLDEQTDSGKVDWEILWISCRRWIHANSEQIPTRSWTSFKTNSHSTNSTIWITRFKRITPTKRIRNLDRF